MSVHLGLFSVIKLSRFCEERKSTHRNAPLIEDNTFSESPVRARCLRQRSLTRTVGKDASVQSTRAAFKTEAALKSHSATLTDLARNTSEFCTFGFKFVFGLLHSETFYCCPHPHPHPRLLCDPLQSVTASHVKSVPTYKPCGLD